MRYTIYLEMESLEAGKGCADERMNSLDDVPIVLVLSIYERSARARHHSLSSLIEEKCDILGRKMSPGTKSNVWFIGRKDRSGISLSPWLSKPRCPWAMGSACRRLRLLADAAANRNIVLDVR